MLTAVIYDPETGAILQTYSGRRENLEAMGVAWLEVEEYRFDYDSTHRVVDGQLEPIA
ncbi:hypothetical protein [Sphingobium olei]|uniref:Uncharacterized protein n=1 Tax=Sphingobium olei TaxID=420955 RepID=A0ABW3NXB0_9SPHN|nr:hypothetical protein [Sphingobium sp.]